MADLKLIISARILARNHSQSRPYESLISHCTLHTDSQLLSTFKTAQSRNSMYERENIVLGKSGSDPTQLQATEQKVRLLEGQLGGIYRDKSENVTTVLALREARDSTNAQIEELTRDLKALGERLETVDRETREKAVEIGQLEEKKAVLRSEIQSVSDKLTKIQCQNETFIKENSDLADRLGQIRLSQAQQMAEINECYESVLKKQQLLESSQFSDPSTSENGQSAVFCPGKKQPLPKNYALKLVGHSLDITACAYNDSGNCLFTAGGDTLIKVWDPSQGLERKAFRGLVHPALSVDISIGTELVLAGSADKTALVWKVATGRLMHTLTGHTGQVTAGKFLSTKKMAATGSQDRTIKLWDVEKGFAVKTLVTYSGCHSVALSHEDSLLASGHYDGTVRFWSPSNGESIAAITTHEQASITSISISNDGLHILTSGNDNRIAVIDLRTFAVLGYLQHAEYRCQQTFAKVCWSSDGEYVLAGGSDGRVFLWSLEGMVIEEIYEGGHCNPVTCVAWSPAKQQFASVDTVGGLVIWE